MGILLRPLTTIIRVNKFIQNIFDMIKKITFIGTLVLLLWFLPEQIDAQTITPATQIINFHTSPVAFSAPGTGTAYQWQSAPVDKESAWQNISGATSPTFSPGVLDSTTCYRVKVSISDTTFYW